MAYCSVDDVVSRLSATGIFYIGDDAEDSSSSITPEEEELVDLAIAEAATEVDEALTPWIDTLSTAHGNEWLRFQCCNVACAILCSRKGNQVPESIAQAAERARAKLELVRLGKTSANGLRVPGLTYPGDGDTQTRTEIGVPLAANPRR